MITGMREGEPIDPTRIRSGNGFKTEFFRWGVDAVLLRSLQIRAAEVYRRAFNLNIIQTADEVQHQMRRDPSFRRSITIASLNGRDIGFLIQELVEVPLSDGHRVSVVWNASRAVDKRHQRKGIATALLKRGYIENAEDKPYYSSGRTQVEPIIRSLMSSNLFDEIPPITREFRKGAERQIVKFLSEEVLLYRAPVNLRTGLVRGVYPEGEAGGYALDLSRPGIQMIHDRFEEIGLRKGEGDAIIYLARDKRYPPLG